MFQPGTDVYNFIAVSVEEFRALITTTPLAGKYPTKITQFVSDIKKDFVEFPTKVMIQDKMF